MDVSGLYKKHYLTDKLPTYQLFTLLKFRPQMFDSQQ